MGARGLEFSLSEASTFYAVHRRLNHLRNLQLISKLHYGYFMDWLLNCLDSLQGKSQYVDMLYNVKPYHPPDYSYLSSKAHARIRLHLSDIVVADDFSQEYMYFHKCLTEQLMKVGEAPYEKASKAVHESFTAELALGLNTLATSSIRVPNPNAPRPLTLVQIAYTAARSALFDRHLVDMLRSPFEFALTTYQLRKRFFPLDTLLRRFPSDGAAMESILTCLEYE